jgi:hypothetical protein
LIFIASRIGAAASNSARRIAFGNKRARVTPRLVRTSTSSYVPGCANERIAPQVVTVKLDQVEGVEEHASVIPTIADALEIGDAAVPRTQPPRRR